MSNDISTRRNAPPAVQYRNVVERVAGEYLQQKLGTEHGQKQAARFALAFASAARAAKKPDDFYRCNPGSLAAAVALSMETGLMPGGAMPAVWLIPRAGELQWMPSHRGLIQLAQAAGYQVRAVPVHRDDEIKVEGGEVVSLEQDPDAWPTGLKDLRGVAVYVTRLEGGTSFCRAWVPAKAIEQRRKAKGAGPVWNQWPVEMAIKSAIRFVFARGYVPIESVELDTAITADVEVAATEVTAQRIEAPGRLPTAAPPAELRTEPAALEDRGEPEVIEADARVAEQATLIDTTMTADEPAGADF